MRRQIAERGHRTSGLPRSDLVALVDEIASDLNFVKVPPGALMTGALMNGERGIGATHGAGPVPW